MCTLSRNYFCHDLLIDIRNTGGRDRFSTGPFCRDVYSTASLGIMVVKGRDSVLQHSGTVIKTEKVSEILEFASLFFIMLIGAGMMTVLL